MATTSFRPLLNSILPTSQDCLDYPTSHTCHLYFLQRSGEGLHFRRRVIWDTVSAAGDDRASLPIPLSHSPAAAIMVTRSPPP